MRNLFILIVVAALIGGGWWYYHDKSAEDHSKSGKNAPTPVGVATIKTGDIDVYLNGLGNAIPRNTITVQSRVSGELMRVLYHEGQLVKAGDLLAQIDERPFQAVLEQTQGLLIRDEALLKEAKIDLKRYQTLYKQDSIAKQQLDLQASLVKQYEGSVRNDQGQVDAAKVNIAYCRIASPVTGRVGLRLVDPGNIINTGGTTGIVVVTQLQPITAVFTIPEDDIPVVTQFIDKGQKLMVEAWDRDSKKKLTTGSLVAVDNEVDPSTGTVKFRAEFANKNNVLFPSQFINIRMRLTTKKDVVLAPTAAIQRGTQGTFVYLVKDAENIPKDANKDGAKGDGAKPEHKEKDKDDAGKAGAPKSGKGVVVQPVTLGTTEGEMVEITKGLSANDVVVIDGADALRNGSPITIIAPNSGDAGKPDATKPDAAKAGAGAASDSKDENKDKSHHKHKKSDDNG
jgi:multidrug efflux system membrane fusion protein